MNSDITYRFVEGPFCSIEDWERIQKIIEVRGWFALNRQTTCVLIAEQGEKLAGFLVFQLIPHTEPLFVAPSFRGTNIADTLADKMIEWLHKEGARGWMVTAEHPSARKMCEARGWIKVEAPVYLALGER